VHIASIPVTAAVAAAALWANPVRLVNRLFFIKGVIATIWLTLLYLAFAGPAHLRFFCVRSASAAGLFLLLLSGMTCDAMANRRYTMAMVYRRHRWLGLFLVAAAALVFTDWYGVPINSKQPVPYTGMKGGAPFGWAYYFHAGIGIVGGIWVFLRRRPGFHLLGQVERMEFQLMRFASIITYSGIMGLMLSRQIFQAPILVRFQPLLLGTYYAIFAWSMTQHRAFDAKQVGRVLFRSVLALMVIAIAYAACDAEEIAALPIASESLVVGFALLLAARAAQVIINRKIPAYPHAESVRDAIRAVKAERPTTEHVSAGFCRILQHWTTAEKVSVQSISIDLFRATFGSPECRFPSYVSADAIWVTLRELERMPATEVRQRVTAYLSERNLVAGAAVLGRTSATVIGVGTPVSRQMYSVAQMNEMVHVAALMGAELERAQSYEKALAAREHLEAGRLRSHQEISASEARYMRLFENIPAGFGLLRLVFESGQVSAFTVEAANPAFQAKGDIGDVGICDGCLLNQDGPGPAGAWLCCLATVERTGRKKSLVGHKTSKGIFDVEIFPSGPGLVGVLVDDVTERVSLERQAGPEHRIESLGLLASRIAHDLNSNLAPAVLALDSLKRRMQDPLAREITESILSSTEKGLALVERIVVFARGAEGEPTPVRPAKVVESVVEVVRHTFPRGVVVEIEHGNTDALVLVDKSQLEQVVMNLAINARESLGPSGGSITVSIKEALLNDREALLKGAETPGRYVKIGVRDTGCGLADAVRLRIFEPFFSTKKAYGNAGLGLSVAHGIVRSYKGFFEVESKVGAGSLFTVNLPVHLPSGLGFR
jgi:signal transduction histidine kinase